MTKYHVEQHRAPTLVFEGDKLADVSSRTPGAERWQEIRIFRTAKGEFVVEVVGQSMVVDERPIRKVSRWQEPHEVVQALYQTARGRTYLTTLAQQAVDDAAKVVPEIADVASEEHI